MISFSLSNLIKKIVVTLVLIALIMAAYMLWARPYQLNWGATDQEMTQAMVGDHLDPDPEFFATRAITITGTPEEIWPWLLQMGYGRAGYYGYDIVENIGSPRGIHSADRILPEFQKFKAGDEVPISSVASMVFYDIEPNRHVIWTGTNQKGSFIWSLYPIDEDHTRLISRIRWSFHWTEPSLLSLDLFTEFSDYLAVREILYGIKGRVENQIEPMFKQNIEVGIYVLTALIFTITLLSLLIRRLTLKRWLTALAAGAVWLLTWFSPLPIWVGVGLELLVLGKVFDLQTLFTKRKLKKSIVNT